MRRVYLDYAATTPVRPEVSETVIQYFNDVWGNPSSIHACGQEARNAVEEGRQKVANLIGARDDEVFFTSGGTESDNMALQGVALARESHGNHIITCNIEHHAILETCRFLEKRGILVTYLPVDSFGMVNPDDVKRAITKKTILISIMHANNEIGTLQPIAEIGRTAKSAGVYFHTDAVQTVGHIPVDVNKMGIDLLSLSGHKLYGPKGVGAIFIRKGTEISPLIHGGEQEKQMRAGTENVPGIAGLAKAAELAGKELDCEVLRLTGLREKLISGILLKLETARLNGHPTQRLPNNVNVSFGAVEGESICLNLDLAGICVSTGSACSSASMEASHVLLAMGLSPEQARSSIRFSMGKWTTEDDIKRVLDTLPGVVSRLRAISPLSKQK
jgi:cysteine desulfurase